MNKILKILRVPTVVLLFFIHTTSSYASKNAVKILIKHQAQFQQGDFSALRMLTRNMLRTAKDDKKGTLYYGGLLLYFNEHQDKAEIALRRAARTKGTPWTREATRLVVYFMIRNARYNQVKPFLEKLLTRNEIRQDLELFYYQALALFLTREYEALSRLLQGVEEQNTKPQWSVTLRQRIAKRNVVFSYDLWSALMTMHKNIKNDDMLYKTLLSHPTEDMIDNMRTYIYRIYSTSEKSIPKHINTVLEAKLALQSQHENAEHMFFSLDAKTFIHPGMIEDLVSIARKNKKKIWPILRILAEARKHAITHTQKSYIDIARAHLYYEKNYYKKSHVLYRDAFANINTYRTLPTKIQNRALWRMLSSIIQTDWKSFVKTFDEVMNYTKNPKYFADVLEEYLSVLLQKKQYAQLQKDFTHLSKQYQKNYITAELNRWYFILKRINTSSKVHTSIQKNAGDKSSVFHRKWSYTSDAPFEYLLYTDNVTKNQFLGSWTISEESARASHIIDEVQRITISETLLEGYFLYGLYNYAYEIIYNNSARVSAHMVRKMARYLLYQTKNHSRVLSLTKRFAAKSLLFPQTEEDFLFLYPNTMFSKHIRSVTKNQKEQAVIYALMREESDFIPAIVSGAGAVGLMQLLPITAQDIASRISYGSFNLRNPKDNIVLGYNYFKYLLRVLKKPVYVFVAYNGGLGNLRKWEDTFDTSDSIIFADSLPFRETRNYMRKVVSSALIYALLYYDVPSDAMIEYLFQKPRREQKRQNIQR